MLYFGYFLRYINISSSGSYVFGLMVFLYILFLSSGAFAQRALQCDDSLEGSRSLTIRLTVRQGSSGYQVSIRHPNGYLEQSPNFVARIAWESDDRTRAILLFLPIVNARQIDNNEIIRIVRVNFQESRATIIPIFTWEGRDLLIPEISELPGSLVRRRCIRLD